jgi:LPXTG-site transpeptidase (sortase) family protein
MPARLGIGLYRFGEVLCYAAGILLSGFFVVQLAQGEVQRQGGIAEFEQLAQAEVSVSDNSGAPSSTDHATGTPDFEQMVDEPDTALWAPGRIADYEASLQASLPAVLGVLEVPSVNLKVPVYQTASDLVMDRGAGIIDGMSYPHEPGNIGISGHRDGYFRVLKDVKVGDPIVLQTLEGSKRFRVEDTTIVEIKDERLLRDTSEQTVTLVTCYPFYFVGHAPKRFIVTASLDTTYVNHN